jgi:hypothetical protein
MDLAEFVERSKQLRARLKAQAEELISPKGYSRYPDRKVLTESSRIQQFRLSLRPIREQRGSKRPKFDPLPLTIQHPLSRRSGSSSQSSSYALSHSPKPVPKPRLQISSNSPSPKALSLLVPVLTSRRKMQATPRRYLFSKLRNLCI